MSLKFLNFARNVSDKSGAPQIKTKLFDKFFGLEKFSEVENLPCCQTQQATHGEKREIEDARVSGLISISHLLLSLPHVGKVLDNGLTEIFQPLQLNLQWLQLCSISKILIIFSFNSMLGLQENFVSCAPHICWDSRNEANFEHIIIISCEGELALVGGLPIDKVLPLSVSHHHVHLLSRYFIHVIFASHKDTLVYLLFQTFSCIWFQVEHQRVDRQHQDRIENQTMLQ